MGTTRGRELRAVQLLRLACGLACFDRLTCHQPFRLVAEGLAEPIAAVLRRREG